MAIPIVYVDTNIFKFSATELPRLKPRTKAIRWGGNSHDVTVHDFVVENPNERIKNTDLKSEAELLPELAALGKEGQVRYVIQLEANLESWSIPNMDSNSGRFYGAPIESMEAPIFYSRVIAGGPENPKEKQFEFLANLENKRFIEIQKITGAYQGENQLNRNQLLDAFHLWCAEHNGCDYFLTMDFKLIKVALNRRKNGLKVKPIRPSELLLELRKCS
jgi:hypothetical protein